ncbi:hypothetical protein HRH25_05420 [Flavisolibacter sp. BT320]|nr:hypothetical protein [Flavisolibacter longurius]
MSSRQLAAILFADVMGYTALMQEDEEQALRVRKKFYQSLSQETEVHDGRVQKWMGDGALCVFNSAIEAVRAAVEVQLAMQQEPKIPLRIGIHTGDIILDEADVYGDGVNLASRIESFAVPGSIFISGKVQDDIKNHKEIQTIFVGRFQLKNVKEPVDLFAVSNPGILVPKTEQIEGKGSVLPSKKIATPLLWTLLALAVIVSASLLYFFTKENKMATVDKSIAILPFRNESTEKEKNESFCNGMTESVLNNLAQVKALHVISRQSVEQYRESKKSISQIARELGVSYILEGSVQRYGNQLKVNAQLIHAGDDRHMWSQEYENEVSNLFAVQSEIAKKITTALSINLGQDEENRLNRVPTQNLAAWEVYQKAYTDYIRFAYSVEQDDMAFEKVMLLCDNAISLDPNMAEAYILKAKTYWTRHYAKTIHKANEEFERENDIHIVAGLCRKALSIDKGSADANTLVAQYHFNIGNSDSAYFYLDRAIALNPNHSEARSLLGHIVLRNGNYKAAFLEFRKVIQLDPLSVWTPFNYNNLGWFYTSIGDLKKAEAILLKSLQTDNKSSSAIEAYTYLTHLYTVNNMGEKAFATAQKWLLLDSTALRAFGEYHYKFKKDYRKAAYYFSQLFFAIPNVAHAKQRYAHTLWLQGRRDTAMILFNEQLEEFQKLVRFSRTFTGAFDYDIAGIYAVLGQKEKAYTHLKQFAREDWPWGSLDLIVHDPFFNSLRNEKAFIDLVNTGMKEKEKQRREIEKLEQP